MAEPDRFRFNMCRVEYEGGGLETDVIEPAFVAANAGSWVINRYQMDDDGQPTGRVERVDRMTECSFKQDPARGTTTVTGQSTVLAEMGVPEDDRTVTVRITPRAA